MRINASDMTFTTISTFNPGYGQTASMATGGRTVVIDFTTFGSVWAVDGYTGGSAANVSVFAQGVVYDGSVFWVTDAQTNTLKAYNSALWLQSSIPLPAAAAEAESRRHVSVGRTGGRQTGADRAAQALQFDGACVWASYFDANSTIARQ